MSTIESMTVRTLLHADADAFYASVALRGRPELAAAPVAAVAHVFIASANYPARACGVRSGSLVQDALARCPDLVLVEVPRAEIEEVGDALLDLFHASARAVEPGSIEEAFLDVGPVGWEGAVEAAADLRSRAAEELGIPVSVGVGRTKLMAKLASRAAKPDGIHVIGIEQEAVLRSGLPISDVWGIGPATQRRLGLLGVEKLADIDSIPPATLLKSCGTTMARQLWGIRNSTDDAVVRPVERRSSLTAEGSIQGYNRPDLTPAELVENCVERACRRAQRAGLAAAGITLTLKPVRSATSVVLKRGAPNATADRDVWLAVARELLRPGRAPELVGVRVTLTGLVPADRLQDRLF